jgi:Arc/MetJ family transcription regulator
MPCVANCVRFWYKHRSNPLIEEHAMPTNLNIDQQLLDEAKRLGGHLTKRAAVNQALREYIERRQRLDALKAFGSFDFDPDFDYKEERKRR